MNINRECSFCNKVEKNIDHNFRTCDLAVNVWCAVENYCPNPINSNQGIIDWIEHLRHNNTWYRKTFVDFLEKVLKIIWVNWSHRNDVVFKNNICNHSYILKLANKNFMRQYTINVLTFLLV